MLTYIINNKKSINQSINQPVGRSVSQSVNQSINQLTTRPTHQSIESASQPASQWVSQPGSQSSFGQPACHQSVSHPISQSANNTHSLDRSLAHLLAQSMKVTHLIHRSSNQSMDSSNHQSIIKEWIIFVITFQISHDFTACSRGALGPGVLGETQEVRVINIAGMLLMNLHHIRTYPMLVKGDPSYQ